MDTHYIPRWGAIALGCLCAAGAGAVLLADVTATGPTIDHALSVIALVVTIAAGHYAWTELRSWRVMAALGLGLVFAGGVAYTVASTAGRSIEQQRAAASEAAARNQARADKVAELETARQRLALAEKMAEREMTGQRCGPRCQDWKQRAAEVTSHVRLLEAMVARLGGERAVNAKLAGLAQLIALVPGADAKRIEAGLVIAWPFVLPLLLELGSIVFWSVGLGRVRTIAPAKKAPDGSGQSDYPALDPAESAAVAAFFRRDDGNGGAPDRPAPRKPQGPDGRKNAVLAALLTDLGLGRTVASQRELSERFGVARSTMSDWLVEWERSGLIPARRTVGRCKALAGA